MACIDVRPNCGAADADVVPEALKEVAGWILAIWGAIGIAITVLKALGTIKIVGDTVFVGTTAIASGFFAGALVGFVAATATFLVVFFSAKDRCTQADTEPECAAGVVNAVVNSFSSDWDGLFPWRAMHDRVDIVVKSRYWSVVEAGNAYVFCTGEERPRRSEILRCYFYDAQVCAAAQAATVGAGVGAVGGMIAAAFIAAALCVTVILCILGLFLAALAAAAAVLAGAFIGGQIGKAASTDEQPTTDTGQTITIGHLVTVRGPMQRRGYDDGANVIYWADSAGFHGMSMSPQPFSYCEIDPELEPDGCPTAEPVIL